MMPQFVQPSNNEVLYLFEKVALGMFPSFTKFINCFLDKNILAASNTSEKLFNQYSIYSFMYSPTLPHEQDVTQGQV